MGVGAIIGGGLGLVGSIIGGNSQKKAANQAADTSMAVAQQNNALARDIYGQNKATLSPFVSGGTAAGEQINALLGMGGAGAQGGAFDRFREASGYNFRFNEGMDALNSGYAGAGVLQSGDAMRAATEFGQNFASNELGNYMGMLGNQQGVGLGAASAQAGVGQNYVNTISQNNNNAGTAAANAALSKGANNPFANALGMAGGFLAGRG